MWSLQRQEKATIGVLLLLLVSWVLVTLNPCRISVLSINGLPLLGAFAVFPALLVLLLHPPQASRIRRVVYGGAVLAIFALYSLGLSRYTDLGILVSGGDGYWLGRAAAEEDERRRECCLRAALSGTQYALNTVETRLMEEYGDEPALQAELFEVLARLAPNEGWESRYRARRDAALDRSKAIETR